MSKEYQAYLQSDEWKAKREWALERGGRKCQICASEDHLDVHHNTYERRGHEWPADLVVLCRECHELFHCRLGKNGPRNPPLSAVGVEHSVERKLLLSLIQSRGLIPIAQKEIGGWEFSTPDTEVVFEALVENPMLTQPPSSMGLTSSTLLEELLREKEKLSDTRRAFEDSLGRIRDRAIARKMDATRALLESDQDPHDQELAVQYLEELAEQRRELMVDWRPPARRKVWAKGGTP